MWNAMKLAKYFFLSGLLASLILWALTIFINSDTIQRISGYTGLGLFIIAIITSGSMVSGDQQRVNFYTEDPRDRREREHVAMAFLLAAIPILLLWGYLK